MFCLVWSALEHVVVPDTRQLLQQPGGPGEDDVEDVLLHQLEMILVGLPGVPDQ